MAKTWLEEFLDDLASAKIEREVEAAYRELLKKRCKGAQIKFPHNTDGLLTAFPNIRALLEFKYDAGLKTGEGRCGVLIQVLFYLKKFEKAGDILPSTIFIGDEKTCFALKTGNIAKYLDSEINWEIAPSSAHKHNAELIRAMVKDNNILPFVYDVNEHFDIGAVIQQIKDLSDNVERKVRVTPDNIEAIFDYFDNNVLIPTKRLSAHDRANLFIQLIINSQGNYLHPTTYGTLVVDNDRFRRVKVHHELFLSFFKHFEGEKYTSSEREGFTACVDRLVEISARRWSGEFFTPKLFVEAAHEYIERAFGKDWRDEYVVWDCASGTGNLTRDYKFKELYVSTLEASEIETMKQAGYNPEAAENMFQYDFLNDGVEEDMFDESGLPEGLVKALETKKVLFLINPPFATASNKSNKRSEKGDDNKEKVAKTKVGKLMSAEKWGGSAQNLYAQFLYRILQYRKINKNVKVAFYSPPLFLSGASYKTFRERFLEHFGFVNGFLFEARHFANVASGWGVSFTVFDSIPNQNKYMLDLLDVDPDIFSAVKIGEKEIYNTDGQVSGNDWIRQIPNRDKTVSALCMKSAMSPGDRVKSVSPDYLASLVCDSNSAMKNSDAVFIISGPPCGNFGNNDITPANFERSVAYFAARKLILPGWVDQKDEYLAPDMKHACWDQFVKDSLVYALFSASAQQSSHRHVEHDGKKWNIKNELFWVSSETMKELADDCGYDELFRDAKTQKDRYVCKLLADGWKHSLSTDARAVLDAATKMLAKSMKKRQAFSQENERCGLDCYDAGYAQLRPFWDAHFKKQHDELKELIAKLETRLRDLVYVLGFLKR